MGPLCRLTPVQGILVTYKADVANVIISLSFFQKYQYKTELINSPWCQLDFFFVCYSFGLEFTSVFNVISSVDLICITSALINKRRRFFITRWCLATEFFIFLFFVLGLLLILFWFDLVQLSKFWRFHNFTCQDLKFQHLSLWPHKIPMGKTFKDKTQSSQSLKT